MIKQEWKLLGKPVGVNAFGQPTDKAKPFGLQYALGCKHASIVVTVPRNSLYRELPEALVADLNAGKFKPDNERDPGPRG